MTSGRQFEIWNEVEARHKVDTFAEVEGGLLPALHKIQQDYGYIDDEAIPLLADVFNLSRAEVHGVVSFYHDFRRARPGRYTIKVCRAEACQAMNGDKLIEHIKSRLQIDFHETDGADAFSLEPVFCLGNCAAAPAIMIDEQAIGRVTAKKFDTLISDVSNLGEEG